MWRHETHSFNLTLSHSLLFSLFSSLCPSGIGGFRVTWALGSPVLMLSLALHHLFLFCRTTFNSISMPVLCAYLALSPSVSLSLSLLSAGFPEFIISMFAACDRAARQEGRQADGHWDLEWLRSGASGAHGERVFPTSVECQRTPIHCLNPRHSSLKILSHHTLGKGKHLLYDCACVGLVRKVLQLLRKETHIMWVWEAA